MKKNNLIALLMIAFVSAGTTASAQIDNLLNCSAEWVRSGTRNAATDATDIMVYNPGGMSMMKPGFHVNVGNQSFMRKPMHEYTFDYGMGASTYKYEQSGNDMFVPNLYMSYNKDKWSVFGGAYIAGGGATANFPHGSINTDMITGATIMGVNEAMDASYTNGKDAYLKASSYYMAYVMGGSYKITEKLSFGMFARYLMAKNTTKAGVTIMDMMGVYPDAPFALNTEDKASGMGVVMGMDYMPSNKLNMSIRFETGTKLNFKTKVMQDDFGMMVDGSKHRRDLPAVLGLGIAYAWTAKLVTMADFNYYFQTSANWGSSNVMGMEQKTSKIAGNAATYSMSLEYKITPKMLASLGGTYSTFNFGDEAGYYTNVGAFETVPQNNVSVNTGLGYNITEKIRINAGYLHCFYKSNKQIKALNMLPADVNVMINNSISSFAISADFRF